MELSRLLDFDSMKLFLPLAYVPVTIIFGYLLYCQDRAHHPWGEICFARIGLAIGCWVLSSAGIILSMTVLFPILAWAWLLIMTGFWVVNKPLGSSTALIGIFLGGGCLLFLVLPSFYYFVAMAEVSWSSFFFWFFGVLFYLVLILPALILAIFLTRFHYLELTAP